MARLSFAVALAVFAVSMPAWAEKPEVKGTYNHPGIAELPSTLKVPQSVLATVVAHDTIAPRAKKKKSKVSATECKPNGCGYKALLGDVPLARDIEASPSIAVRVLPTAHALSGSDAAQPILVRPRVDASGNYGVNVRAQF